MLVCKGPTQRKRKYIDMDNRKKKLLMILQTGTFLDFLRGIAYNLKFAHLTKLFSLLIKLFILFYFVILYSMLDTTTINFTNFTTVNFTMAILRLSILQRLMTVNSLTVKCRLSIVDSQLPTVNFCRIYTHSYKHTYTHKHSYSNIFQFFSIYILEEKTWKLRIRQRWSGNEQASSRAKRGFFYLGGLWIFHFQMNQNGILW